ncbi:MAG: HalX domain-containing protein [Haloferacaceae archaeon]
MTTEPHVVLVVEDERDLADLYTAWLADTWTVRTAHDYATAVDRLDGAVDVALLDRRLPDGSGDDVLAAIEAREIDCRAAMVTAVEPDFDIVEMGFDDYLVKPVSRDDLHEAVDRLSSLATYDERVREYFALASKKAVLDAEKSPAARETSDEYARLVDDLAAVRETVDATLDDLDGAEHRAVLRDLPPSDSPDR